MSQGIAKSLLQRATAQTVPVPGVDARGSLGYQIVAQSMGQKATRARFGQVGLATRFAL